MSVEKVAIVIPARMASTRLPGKCLADIHGEPLIWRVYQGCMDSEFVEPNDVFVITPDVEILSAVRDRGGKSWLTGPASTVLERCSTVAGLNPFMKYDVVVVVQGDEPMVKPEMIDRCIVDRREYDVSCLVKKLNPKDDPVNPNMVKLVMDQRQRIIYFSRQPIPGVTPERHKGIERPPLYKQVCVMGFKRKTLAYYNKWDIGPLERAEGIDQLRYIENGVDIIGVNTIYETQAVDTQEDLDKVRRLMK